MFVGNFIEIKFAAEHIPMSFIIRNIRNINTAAGIKFRAAVFTDQTIAISISEFLFSSW